MSFFRVILVILWGCAPSLLMGMEKEQKVTTFKYSNPYFDSELQKSLTLIMLKNRNATEVADLDKDALMVIAKKNYDLHCDASLMFSVSNRLEENLHKLNDESRIARYEGTKIEIDDFDLMTMNDEGRDIFFHFTSALSHKSILGSPNYFWRCYVDLEDESKRKQLGLLSVDDYNKMLHLPVKLRSKVGKLCAVKTIGPDVPYYFSMTKHVIKDTTKEISAIIRDIPNRDRILLTMISGASIGFALSGLVYGERFGSGVSCLSSSGYYAGSGIVCGFGGLTALLGTVIARDRQNYLKEYGPEFELLDKSILTLEEQENIKKVEKEAQEKREQRAMALYKPMKTKQLEPLTKRLSKNVQFHHLSLKNKE